MCLSYTPGSQGLQMKAVWAGVSRGMILQETTGNNLAQPMDSMGQGDQLLRTMDVLLLFLI